MKLPRLKTVLITVLTLFVALYAFGAISLVLRDDSIAILEGPAASFETVAIFGASGTTGDGILKAAMAAPEIEKIHVVTRRLTPRIEEGVASGKVHVTEHMDYLDYSAIEELFVDVDAVYWAIGISARGVDQETYRMIHTDFPRAFVEAWLSVSRKPDISFHFISSSDISEDSRMMWVQEKIRAERTLFGLAERTHLRVIAYRPDYIGPTEEEAHIGQDILYGFFAPVGAAVRAVQIGEAMIEATARGSQFANGDKVGTWNIKRYSDAYTRRMGDTD
jgi:hypothetical protein